MSSDRADTAKSGPPVGSRRSSKRFVVLVFPGGTEIGLEIHRALSPVREVELLSAAMDVSNHAPYVYARHFVVPSIHEDGWVEALGELIEREGVNYVFPAYDDVLLALAENAARIPARIVTSPLRTCAVTRSKTATYEAVAGAVPTPVVFGGDPLPSDFPVFLKPDRGQGSEDTHLARDPEELRWLRSRKPDHVVLEYLPGEEFTVDCFSDREEGLLYCAGRTRTRTKSGISMSCHAAPEHDALFRDYAEAISGRLEFHGAWFFQVKRAGDGPFKLLEIAPRIAGTMALHRVQGVNFPLLSLYEQERAPVSIRSGDWGVSIDRALVNRYRHTVGYSTVYMDLDDLLIVRDAVNPTAIRFLYQCVNDGKRLVLLTKTDGDLDATLKRFRLTGLFDEVRHIRREEQKADYVAGGDAIFIDDSFREREAVRQKRGIPTFDGSMIEMLIDERI
jgi:hypothetical protein